MDYRLAPEHSFPGPVYNALDALEQVQRLSSSLLSIVNLGENASYINEPKVNPRKGFLVSGIIAGGDFSAVVSHLYRDEGLSPSLTGVYLSIPSTYRPDALPEKSKEFYLSRE